MDAYQNCERPERCIVTLYEKYIAHRPPLESCKTDAFYLRPLQKPTEFWYSPQAVGRHTLAKVIGRICKDAGITGHKTNHSLRATAASRLYQNNFDEQLISEVTGHRSNAVRAYKRTTDAQRRGISACIRSAVSVPPVPAPSSSVSASTSASEQHGYTINVNINVPKEKRKKIV